MNSKNISRIITIIVLIIVIIAIILLLKGKGDTATIKLNGASKIVIYKNDKYTDLGYKIVDTNNNAGFYVNIEGKVDTNKIGIYYIKYLLYNKNGSMVSSAQRQVVVLENDGNDLLIELNGEEEEYFFINDYIDHGAVAYQKNVDVSDQIVIDTNLNSAVEGRYEVRYQIYLNNSIKEVTRIVNIVDYNIKKDIDLENLVINLLVDCDNYSYTILPNGIKEYTTDVSYSFTDVGSYKFDIYLKNGSHREYVVEIDSIDNEGPVGTCVLYHENKKTTISMNVTDKSGIGKYVYNGIEFYEKQKELNILVPNVTVRAYDKYNNYTDIKCKAEFKTGFRNISVSARGVVANKIGYMDKLCNKTAYTNENKELNQLVQSYGYKTRGSVVAAAVYLATYKYDVPYFWGGKYDGIGFSVEWGCNKQHKTDKPCSISKAQNNTICAYGLDCGGLIGWAYRQSGFDKKIIRYEDIVTTNWGNFNPRSHYYQFNSNNQVYINQLKPGDMVHRSGHIGLVIGVTDDKIQVAEMLGPLLVTTYNKNTGASLTGQKSFTHFLLMDEFFKMYGN